MKFDMNTRPLNAILTFYFEVPAINNIEAARFIKTSIFFYKSTRRHNTEVSHTSRRRRKLISYMDHFIVMRI
jgi:hypothetical protein